MQIYLTVSEIRVWSSTGPAACRCRDCSAQQGNEEEEREGVKGPARAGLLAGTLWTCSCHRTAGEGSTPHESKPPTLAERTAEERVFSRFGMNYCGEKKKEKKNREDVMTTFCFVSPR